jgi:hypothetical protein
VKHVSHLPSTLPQVAPQGKATLVWGDGGATRRIREAGERSQRFFGCFACDATRFTRSNARATAVLGNVDAGASWGAALRFGTAESQDESRCSAIHKFKGEGNGARCWLGMDRVRRENFGAGLRGLMLGGGFYGFF